MDIQKKQVDSAEKPDDTIQVAQSVDATENIGISHSVDSTPPLPTPGQNTYEIPAHTHNGVDTPRLSFTGLRDVPNSYKGNEGKSILVNAQGTALEFKASANMFAGNIASSGSAIHLPDGWSSVRTGPGLYTITHNLATTQYIVVGTVITGGRIFQNTIDLNSFDVFAFSTSGVSVDSRFEFILLMY